MTLVFQLNRKPKAVFLKNLATNHQSVNKLIWPKTPIHQETDQAKEYRNLQFLDNINDGNSSFLNTLAVETIEFAKILLITLLKKDVSYDFLTVYLFLFKVIVVNYTLSNLTFSSLSPPNS